MYKVFRPVIEGRVCHELPDNKRRWGATEHNPESFIFPINIVPERFELSQKIILIICQPLYFFEIKHHIIVFYVWSKNFKKFTPLIYFNIFILMFLLGVFTKSPETFAYLPFLLFFWISSNFAVRLNTFKFKDITSVKKLLYQLCFTNTSPSINNNDGCFIFFVNSFKTLQPVSAAYKPCVFFVL